MQKSNKREVFNEKLVQNDFQQFVFLVAQTQKDADQQEKQNVCFVANIFVVGKTGLITKEKK